MLGRGTEGGVHTRREAVSPGRSARELGDGADVAVGVGPAQVEALQRERPDGELGGHDERAPRDGEVADQAVAPARANLQLGWDR